MSRYDEWMTQESDDALALLQGPDSDADEPSFTCEVCGALVKFDEYAVLKHAAWHRHDTGLEGK